MDRRPIDPSRSISQAAAATASKLIELFAPKLSSQQRRSMCMYVWLLLERKYKKTLSHMPQRFVKIEMKGFIVYYMACNGREQLY